MTPIGTEFTLNMGVDSQGDFTLNSPEWAVPLAQDILYRDLGDTELRDLLLGSEEEGDFCLFVRRSAFRLENGRA